MQQSIMGANCLLKKINYTETESEITSIFILYTKKNHRKKHPVNFTVKKTKLKKTKKQFCLQPVSLHST